MARIHPAEANTIVMGKSWQHPGKVLAAQMEERGHLSAAEPPAGAQKLAGPVPECPAAAQ